MDGGLLSGAASGDLPLVRCLLADRASIEATNTFGDTPFLLAANKGDLSIMRLLLK
jgi:ankyrin repeat protein